MLTVIDGLLAKMTLDEKIGQLNLIAPGGFAVTGAEVTKNAGDKIRAGAVGGLFGCWGFENIKPWQDMAVKQSRLGIPLIFGLDVIHGHKTVFPIPLALSCMWDMDRIRKSARLAAVEATAEGVHWVFSPMVDISRDARWGRVAEGAGEDAWLGSQIAKAMVEGYQGTDLSRHDTVLACVKHFALYGAPEGGREYNTVDMSRIRMFEEYFPPYQAAIDAGAGTVMTSFNEVDGVPATGNRWLLTDVLRRQWGFTGMVVTDYTAINEMTAHGMGGLKDVSAQALHAGTDMDMVGEGFLTTLKQSLDDGAITLDEIDQACRRILEAKQRLGLFDDPYRYLDEKRAPEKILCPEHRAAARDFAAQSCVLLKNDNAVLPLKKNGTIAVVGPLADDRKNMPGTWAVAGEWKDCVTLLEGIKSAAGDAKIIYARGANITDDQSVADRIAIFGNNRIDIDPRPQSELIAEAVAAAKQADVVVAVVGEAQEMSGESASRSDIRIPPHQLPLLQALAATGKPVALVVFSGRPLDLSWEDKTFPSILAAWFGGTEAGNGIADVLFGAHNPAAKLTMTFPRNVGQVPIHYAHKNTGRPYLGTEGPEGKFKSRYLDVENTPLYAFGHGVSYTTFAYGDLQLSQAEMTGEGTLHAGIRITNTGNVAGGEVVQLYISDPVASVARPVKVLRGFEKIFLQPGESRTVTFAITPDMLKFYNSSLEHVWEPGEFIIHAGGASDRLVSASVIWRKTAALPKISGDSQIAAA
jgi:beta-glucosidase